MTQRAKVIAAEGDVAQVAIVRKSACANDCSKCGGCSAHATKELLVQAKNTLNARPGDVVLLETSDRQILAGAFILYLMPVAAFLLGYLVPLGFGLSEALCGLLGGIAFALSIGVLMLYDRRVAKKAPLPVVTKLIFRPPDPGIGPRNDWAQFMQ